MLYFPGNCQMDFLSRSVMDLGHEAEHRVLASPLTYASSPGRVPPELARLFRNLSLDDYVSDRTLANQFQVIAPGDPEPELIVLNLFHETAPLFMHRRDGYIFFLDPAAWAGRPELEAWMRQECGLIRPNPATYLKRYGKFLAALRANHPGVPIIVVSRLSHFPAFGPRPHSYLRGWDSLRREAPAHFRVWQRELDDVHLLDMDRVFGAIWTESDAPIETHCPFLKIELTETDGTVTELAASRDVEHIGSLWPRLAARIEGFLEAGRIEYDAAETVPREWNRPWHPRPMDEETMLAKLASRGNYPCAEAVGAFFLDLKTDYTELLARTGHLTPVCHNTLHMIKNYGRIFRNPALALWADAHEKTARRFTANGPLYRADYLKRIGEIRAFALS
ncbi:MAG: SGNH/GDSL hydrolase family protein [Desulfovibrionaceae bacterium]|nr:SGNH/GDSL hydrolase family protein [Desulfovibrionaceae bacterium]